MTSYCYDPEDDYLPPWEEVKKRLPKWYLDLREKRIAKMMKNVAAEARRKRSLA